jgi:hypothetical protein
MLPTATTLAIASLGLAAACFAPPAGAQAPAGPSLDSGPYGVGFRIIEALDSTRAFRPLRDFRGRLAAETARPVQVSVWYPAPPATTAPRMSAGQFRLARESDVDFDVRLTPADEDRLRSAFIDAAVDFGADRAAAAGVWDRHTPAVRNATPLPGPHPTVLYFTAAGVSNPLLPAYLASHGFVVASFPSNGRMTDVSLEFTPNALTLDTDIDDAGFVYALLRRLPYADTRRLAVASFSNGSLAALLWQMRDMQASAIVTLEGWERYRRGADIIAGSVHYEPHRVRIPFLMIERAADERSPQYARVPDVVGGLPYAEITRVAFRDAAHADFLSHVAFGHTPRQPAIYRASAGMIRLFLEAALGGDSAAESAFADLSPPPDDPFFTVARDAATGPVPTEEELYRLAETDPAGAAAAYRDAAGIVPGNALFREAVLTRAAIFAPTPVARITIMEIVVAAYSTSTAARFRLAEALADAARPEDAAAAFATALSLVEGDAALEAAERGEWRDRIRSALEEVRTP